MGHSVDNGNGIIIEGRYITNGRQDAQYGHFSIQQIQSWLENGDFGMLHTPGYTIDGCYYSASALSISKDHGIPLVRDGKIVVPTSFRRAILGPPHRGQGSPEDLVNVEAIIEPNTDLFVSVCQNDQEDER